MCIANKKARHQKGASRSVLTLSSDDPYFAYEAACACALLALAFLTDPSQGAIPQLPVAATKEPVLGVVVT
jgi:hypothetical protein